MKAITVRNISQNLERLLNERRKSTGKSINRIIIDILQSDLNPTALKNRRHDDLDHLAGTWTKHDEQEFLNNIAQFSMIDKDLWK